MEQLLLLDEYAAMINDINENGVSALSRACMKTPRLDVVQVLLRVKGIDVNLKEPHGKHWEMGGDFPLINAVDGGSVDVVRELLKRKELNIHATNNLGFTALHKAARQGHVEIVKELLKAGIDKNAKTIRGQTVKDVAIFWKHPDVVALL